MFRSRMFLIGTIGVILLVSILGIKYSPAQTTGFVNPREQAIDNQVELTEDVAIPNPALQTTAESEESATKAERSVVDVDAQLASDDEQAEIRQAIQALVAQNAAKLHTGPGWLHIQLHHLRNKDKSSALSNGQAIPLNYISDTWYHLNEQGQAVEVVAFMRTEEGDPVQISTFKDNMWRNLTIAEEWAGDPFTPQLDLGFSADANRAEGGGTLRQQMSQIAGQPVVQFTLREDFDAPLQMEGYAHPMVAAERRASFAEHSGDLVQMERVFVTEDGQELVVEHIDVISNEYPVEPAAEVLALLQQEVTQ